MTNDNNNNNIGNVEFGANYERQIDDSKYMLSSCFLAQVQFFLFTYIT